MNTVCPFCEADGIFDEWNSAQPWHHVTGHHTHATVERDLAFASLSQEEELGLVRLTSVVEWTLAGDDDDNGGKDDAPQGSIRK